MQQLKYKFAKNRNIAKNCPCGKDNKNGKFAPYVGADRFGFCHSCGKNFMPINGSIEVPLAEKKFDPQTSFHSLELVEKSYLSELPNHFIQFLYSVFTKQEVDDVVTKYFIGTSKKWNGATVFWQIDANEFVHAGKVLLFDAKVGKRQKTAEGKSYINWVHSILKLKNFNLSQCLFGLHQIADSKLSTIALVEGEKSAVIMSLFKPKYIWLGTGSKRGFKFEMLKPIKDYKIIAFPDKSEYNDWLCKAKELNAIGFNIVVNDWIENTNYPDGTDLADIYIEEIKSCKDNTKKSI